MIDRKALLADLQRLLKAVEADLLERSESPEVPDVGAKLRADYAEARQADRTARSFEEWRADAITQHAAAWVLSCVFVRFLEDNALVDAPKLSGPAERLNRARDERELYFRAHPTHTDRDYLLSVFDGLTSFTATEELFGPHNPIRDLPNWLSGDAATLILDFLQTIDANTGALVHDFGDPAWDTRFLGDLYQDLSEAARKTYALLQTPEFVEEFILNKTLDPALDEFGLARLGYEDRLERDGRLRPDDRFRMIDPACGSGHFLLGSFARLLEHWRKREPGAGDAILVQRALDSVHGVDLNPYAIAIARFRLLIAALRESSARRLADAPGFVIHLACGNSLLHGSDKQIQGHLVNHDPLAHVYQPEDREALVRLLRPESYHAVVANPPYITPKDRAQNQAYRIRFTACYRQYSLAVPFMQRIVLLAVEGGFTGQITANSFMKREFGKKLIEEFIPRVDLTHVVDTSGAYIPGHGTPTVILFIRNRKPVASAIRTVMGIRGEPATPDNPAQGLVWSAIVDQIDKPDSQSEFVSAGDSDRALFGKHPWSIGGGGAAELKERLEEDAERELAKLISSIGFASFTGQDEAFVAPDASLKRSRLPAPYRKQFVVGDTVRDWSNTEDDYAFAPYDSNFEAIELDAKAPWARWIWPMRTAIGAVVSFGGKTRLECGDKWWSWYRWVPDKYRTPLSIAFGEVTTHNHFVLDRGGKVFKQTAPVIKLPPGATEEDHLALLGLLNSSTTCFWLKQVCHNKGSTVDLQGARQRTAPFEDFYAFNATKLASLPISENSPTALARQLDDLAQTLQSLAPGGLLDRWSDGGDMPGSTIREAFASCERLWEETRERMIALQEELDWECYRLYGLIDEDLTYGGEVPPGIRFGERAFEMVMGSRMAAGELETTWFQRHGAEPIVEPRADWPDAYRDLVARRIEAIATIPEIALIEQPEYKRRWNTESWESQLGRALRSWLLDRLESYFDFDGRMNDQGAATAKLPKALISVGRLADSARRDERFHEVGALYRDDPGFDVERLVAELVESESVPLLPVLRYKASGLRKRREWERTWELQRLEDALDARTTLPEDDPRHLTEGAAALRKKEIGPIAVPPKYTSADFPKSDWWRLRGKLDVPKERWTSFPHCEGEDGSLMVAWAGFDHLQLALAVSAHFVDVQERLGGRDDPRLVPLLACVAELLPWLKQWHNHIDPEFGSPMGDYFEGFLQEESRNLGLTLEEIQAWLPPQKPRARRRRASG